MRKLALILTLLLGPLVASPAAAQERYVMRHLNTPAGERDPDLTAEGRAAAEALANWFYGKTLTVIYVSEFKRTRQTVEPLAAGQGIPVKTYDPANTPALIARIKEEPGAVLIVGHSNTVPDIVEQLGGERPAPLTHGDFGDIWTIVVGKTERAKL